MDRSSAAAVSYVSPGSAPGNTLRTSTTSWRNRSKAARDPTTIQIKQQMSVEVDGQDKPACVAETLTRLVYG